MTVTKEEFNQERDKLHAKIDSRYQSVLDKIDDKVTDPINGLILKIGIMLEKYDSQEKTNTRLSKDIEKLEAYRQEDSERLARVEEKVAASKGLWDRLVIPLIMMVIVALSALNYWK